MNKVEKIKAEIERRYEYWKEKESNSHSIESESRMSECQHLLLLFNSLQEEPVSNDLEETSKQYALNNSPWDDCWPEVQDAFKAGAQWQQERDQFTIELAEDHAMLAGMEKMKEEMIDKFFKWLAKHWREYVWLTDNNVIHFGHWEYDFKKAMEE